MFNEFKCTFVERTLKTADVKTLRTVFLRFTANKNRLFVVLLSFGVGEMKELNFENILLDSV